MAVYTKLEFENVLNTSLQIDDMIYVSDILAGGTVSSTPVFAGSVLGVGSHYLILNKNPTTAPIITEGQFILFAKNIEVNKSSLKGYYADITFENSSTTKTELFAISSEVAPSSK